MEPDRRTPQSSPPCFGRKAPASRRMAASPSKTTTNLGRRAISSCGCSSLFVLWSLSRWVAGEPLEASTSGSNAFIRAASLGTLGRMIGPPCHGRRATAASSRTKAMAMKGEATTPSATGGGVEHVALGVHTARWPRRAQRLGGRRPDNIVYVRDREIGHTPTRPPQLAQEGRPERLGFRRSHVHAEHIAPTVTVDADSQDGGYQGAAAVLANLHGGRLDPTIRPPALDGPVEERADPLVDRLPGQPDLVLRPAGTALRAPHLGLPRWGASCRRSVTERIEMSPIRLHGSPR